jgi:cell division protein FtsI/penicillin-binding protein 2
MARHVRRNLLLGVGLALGAAVIALGRDDEPPPPPPAAIAPDTALAPVPPLAPLPLPPPRPTVAAAASPAPSPAADAPRVAPSATGAPTIDLTRMELRGDRYLAPMSDGRTAILTIDPAIQAVAEKVLRRARAPRGAIVVTHPDGRILALAGRRTEDPTGAGEAIADPQLALDAWAPSASIFKVVSAAALVEAGVGKSDRVCFHGGVRSVMESNLGPSSRDNRCEDLAYGVAHSQNAIIAKLVHAHLTPRSLGEVAHRLGFDRPLPLPAGGAFGHVTLPADKGVEFAKAAAGFTGVTLSAVGGALLANTVGNGGLAVSPRLIAGYLTAGSEVVAPAPPAATRVLEETVANEVASMMAEACADGSAAKAFAGRDRIPGVAVAGKTGTLSATDPFYMQYSWFTGFAPADKPQLAISVVLGNPELWQIKAHTAARMVLVEALKSRAGT